MRKKEASSYIQMVFIVCCLLLRGDWPVKFWSQNVPEQVFVFFQVWVPKHAYFSSKSVFL